MAALCSGLDPGRGRKANLCGAEAGSQLSAVSAQLELGRASS